MEKVCKISNQQFQISDKETFYCQERAIPLPDISPQERFRQMLAFYNEGTLFERTCSYSKKKIISCHRPDTVYPVYDREIWLSDAYDPLEFGQDYDFNKPFFQQFQELANRVPREATLGAHIENSPYINSSMNLKNCHYVFNSIGGQDCMYCILLNQCRDSFDLLFCSDCELCYEGINLKNCYHVLWGTHSNNCSDSYFIYGCKSCTNCFGCVGLINKNYCIWNKQYTKEEYQIELKKLLTGNRTDINNYKKQLQELIQKTGYIYESNVAAEECTGTFIDHSANAQSSHFIHNCHDIEHSLLVYDSHDVISTIIAHESELLYRNMAVGVNSYNTQFCYVATNLVECQYSGIIIGGDHLFGCLGFNRKQQYCILNKQYSKSEYEELVPRIIAHMKDTGEYGQWFPWAISDYPYSDTVAQQFFPLNDEQALKMGVRTSTEKAYPTTDTITTVSENIQDVEDTILQQTLRDPINSQAFRLQKQELQFYRDHKIPVPEHSFENRHLARAKVLFRF